MAWTTPKTWNVGDILTAADMNTYVRDNTGYVARTLVYTQITSSVTVTGTTEATATNVVTASSFSYDGSRVAVQFYTPQITAGGGTNTGSLVGVWLRDSTVLGDTDAGRYQYYSGIGDSSTRTVIEHWILDTPASGNHTYSWRAYGSGPSWTVSAGAGGSGVMMPAFIRVTEARV